MYIKVSSCGRIGGVRVNLRCPHCGRLGVFEALNEINDAVIERIILGQRMCPNRECKGHIFFVQDHYGNIIVSYPSERIDFEKNGIPKNVLSTFEEAITCHANQCYIASAIMIRKTLEEICLDRIVKGENLKERIKDLGNKIVIPNELLLGMDELRLLGNDATHIESREFCAIEQKELEVAIDFTKEILKAVYQYEHLLGKLKSLKKTKP